MANGALPRTSLPIVVAGPTGVGKTAFAVELARMLDGEVIGADAFQVYQGLEILTNQPSRETLSLLPHHLIGFLPPTECFSAARFAALAREKIEAVTSRGKVPIVAGGSGLYVKALTHGLGDMPPADPELRAELAGLSPCEARERLRKLDPAARIDFQNPRRVLRALEISILTGRPASERRREWKQRPILRFRGILLVRQREELLARISENVRRIFERGAIGEVARLAAIGPTASMAIGLRDIQALLRGECTEPECLQAVAASTRRYAKRQLTWFRNQFTFEIIDLTKFRDTPALLPLVMPSLAGLT